MIELNWRNSESLVKPAEIDDTSSPNGVYIRRFITEITDEEGVVKYQYKEAFLTKEEFSQYIMLQSIIEKVLGEDTSDAYLIYKQQLDTPVEYPVNNHMYKPKWAADIYEGLVNRGANFSELFPIKIWDATEKEENAVMMSLEELKALTLFLGEIQEQLFNAYKASKKKLAEDILA